MAEHEPLSATSSRDGETEDMIPQRGTHSPPTIHRVNRRPFGIGPVPLLGGALILALLLAIVLLALGVWLVGIVLLAASLGLHALLLIAVEREPDDPAARLAATAADHARSETRVIGVAVRAWSRVGVAVLRFTQRRYRLRWQLRRQLAPLGEATHRGDRARVEALKEKAQRLEEGLHEVERETSAAVRTARAEVERERTVTQPTQSFPVEGSGDE